MTTKEKFIGDILGSLRNKPCSFGHAVPTRMCSSCGPFPDPMVSLDVLLESQVRDLTNSHSEKVVRKLNEDVAQFRADCIRLSAEVRDLTGERERAVLLGIEGGYRCMCEDPEDTLPEDVRKAALSHIEEMRLGLSGVVKKNDYLETEEFYNLMQAYRHTHWQHQYDVIKAFEAVKTYLRTNRCK